MRRYLTQEIQQPLTCFGNSVNRAVPCFCTYKGVFGVVSSFPSIESLLTMLRIPSYSFDKEPRFEHLILFFR
ncbi:hypothetical protein [Algoriphagus resistens]|uniref:hypothetical protein n=1 Tax=Algoriphagus resistens TaxID=1750590 RepID=UPI000A5CA0EC|nr:hypothetical protein [Algoriphagus resistens]